MIADSGKRDAGQNFSTALSHTMSPSSRFLVSTSLSHLSSAMVSQPLTFRAYERAGPRPVVLPLNAPSVAPEPLSSETCWY